MYERVVLQYGQDRRCPDAVVGAGECAQRITDLPKTKDMVEKVMGDAEAIIRGLAAKYVAD